jgi:hypothetical protein
MDAKGLHMAPAGEEVKAAINFQNVSALVHLKY